MLAYCICWNEIILFFFKLISGWGFVKKRKEKKAGDFSEMDHTEIRLVIESRLSGPASGHLYITAASTDKIDSIIREFCREKDIPYHALYVLRTNGDCVLENDRTIGTSNVGDGDVLYLTTFSKY